MFYILALLLCGISFAPLLLSKLDMWHAQGIFAQIVILIAFSWSFFEKPKFAVKNIPLGLLHLWIGLNTAYICYQAQVVGSYDIKHFFVYFNFLCVLILYQIIVQYLETSDIMDMMTMMRYVVIATLLMCVLQRFDIAQFFKMFINDPNPPLFYHMHNNPVVGFIGNGTHLSGFLASTIPLFLWNGKREDYLTLILMGIILFYTSTTLNDPAISGFIVALAVWLYWIKREKYKLFATLGILGVGGYFLYGHIGNNLFSFNGRLGMWEYYWNLFIKGYPITGFGLGTLNIIYGQTPFAQARHLHLEYFQYLIELGVIGLILIFNFINSFFHKKADDPFKTQLCLKACFFGFLISCLFNYPSHLWLPATWAVFFYAAFINLKGQDEWA